MFGNETSVNLPNKMKATGHDIKKVVDFRLDNGKRYYKVKWESSWEAEDNLLEHQVILDQFWNFVNRVKSDSEHPQKKRKRARVINTEHQNSLYKPLKSSEVTNFGMTAEDNQSPIIVSNEIDDTSNTDQVNESDNGTDNLYSDCEPKRPATLENLTKLTEGSLTLITPDRPSMVAVVSCYSPQSSTTPSLESNDETNKTDFDKTADSGDLKRDANDVALSWDNPYVRIAFFCRVCKAEQPFQNTEETWRQHFLSKHTSHLSAESPVNVDVTTKAQDVQDLSPDTPWIRRVESLIQRWGVNQYVRIAFLCRICDKEQQPHHTGNWRNHQYSHRNYRPFTCPLCFKTFKSKYDQKRHIKTVHEGKEQLSSHDCIVCKKHFGNETSLKRHTVNNYAKPNEEPLKKTVYACVQCSITLETLAELNRHKLQTHQSVKLASGYCNDCHLFQNMDDFDRHRKKHHSPKNQLTLPVKNDISVPTPSTTNSPKTPLTPDAHSNTHSRVHTCKFCHKGFKRRYDLNRHTSNVHGIDFNTAKRINCDSSSPENSVNIHEVLTEQAAKDTKELIFIIKEEADENSSEIPEDEKPDDS